jgi:hypothetical protein
MKTNKLIIGLLVATMGVFSSCSSTKKVEKMNKATEITLPLSGKQYHTNRAFFRAVQSGKSPDLSTAKKIALQNAKSEMAGNIQATIKKVTHNYTNQRTMNNAQVFENKFEELSREFVNQALYDVHIIGSKIFKERDNTYTYWIAIETSKDNILKGINQSVSKNKQLQIDFDKNKFDKIFDEEMQKYESNQ